MTKTVCILTSGRGTRMNEYSKVINKSLLPFQNKAILSHIISQFPDNFNFVIALGFLGHQVKDYLSIAHPHLNVKYVEVDKYTGEGSGPGYSLLCCKKELNKPFYFTACDTLLQSPIDFTLTTDWLGTGKTLFSDPQNYCNLKVINKKVIEIRDKTFVPNENYYHFNGFCHIANNDIFWQGLEQADTISGEIQISSGFQALIKNQSLEAIEFDWINVGNFLDYQKLTQKNVDFDFSKKDEFFYDVSGKIIKFFSHEEIAKKRVERAQLNPAAYPLISDSKNQFYAYKKVTGNTLYEKNNPNIFTQLLNWLDGNNWNKISVDENTFQNACKTFYHTKTLQRLDLFHKKFPEDSIPQYINGKLIPSISHLLSQVPWEQLYKGTPVHFHGDLQFDNILYDSQKEKFTLLDWRQDFGGHTQFGDIYYDFAKLYGGLIIHYDYIKKNLFEFEQFDNDCFLDYPTRLSSQKYKEILEKFIIEKNYSLEKVKILVGLIFLNMAPLHHPPFDIFLYSVARLQLNDILNK